MAKMDPNQTFDEMRPAAGGAGTARESINEAARRAERRARSRTRAAAETLHEKTEEAAAAAGRTISETAARVEEAASRNAAADWARAAGERVGTVTRYVRELQAEDVVRQTKEFVRRHPSSLLCAAAAGFVVGRMLRGR